MSFWKKVCYELDYQGMSRKELAFKIEVPVARINRAIERDSQPFAIDAIRISKVLNVSLEYLLDLPASTDNKSVSKEESHQIELYKKYHTTIAALENLPREKQKEAVEIVKQLVEFGK